MTSTPIRVLLADDHAVVRKGIREFLEAALAQALALMALRAGVITMP